MDSLDPLPHVVHVDDRDDPGDVIDTMALGPFVAGQQPFARTTRVARVRKGASLLPPGTEAVRSARLSKRLCLLATGPGWTLKVSQWHDESAYLVATATREDLAVEVLTQATKDAEAPAPPEDDAVEMGFWSLSGCGRRAVRTIEVSPWPKIRRNYASEVTASLDRLMAITTDQLSGRLMLLHGPPGTGKTTILRALAHAWRKWCTVDCVLDPERLFREPGYLMQVALGLDDDEDDAPTRWRLLIAEDCDELIKAEAKEATGQSLSRLLNMTDGLMGQGLRVLFGITTNEDLTRLHPAITRPGRCLARIEVGRFPRAEAAKWLGHLDGIGPDGVTLAELFALRGELEKVERVEPPRAVGQYL